MHTDATSEAGTEKSRVGDTCPIVPGCLTPELRARWIDDFTELTRYAMGKGLDTDEDLPWFFMRSTDEDILSIAIHNPEKIACKRRKAHNPPTASSLVSDPPSVAQRDANKQLYLSNKKLVSANASMKSKLDRMRTTLSSLTSKIEDKIGEKVDASDSVERVPAAVRLLLLSHSDNSDKNQVNDSAEVSLLSNQLQKLNAAYATLQSDLVGLQSKLKEVRQQTKDRAKAEKKK